MLSCIVYLPSRVTADTMLNEKNHIPKFIGITDVTTHSAIHGLFPAKCDVAILRRRAIESLELTDQPLANPGAANQEAEEGHLAGSMAE